jgi:hypothetical protein
MLLDYAMHDDKHLPTLAAELSTPADLWNTHTTKLSNMQQQHEKQNERTNERTSKQTNELLYMYIYYLYYI